MARTRVFLTMKLSEDDSEETSIYERERDTGDDDVSDAYNNANSRMVSVPPSSTVGIPLAGLTNLQFIYIESDKAISLRFNGSSDQFPLMPRAAVPVAGVTDSIPAKFLAMADGLTSLMLVNNDSAATASVKVVLAGT